VPKGVKQHFHPAFCGTVLGYVETETGDGLAKVGTVHQFGGPEPALLVCRQNIR